MIGQKNRLRIYKNMIALALLVLVPLVDSFSLTPNPETSKEKKSAEEPAKLSYKRLIRNFEIAGTALIATGYGLSLLHLKSDSMLATARQTAGVGCLSGGSLLLASLYMRNIWNNAYKDSSGKKADSFHLKNLINCLDKNLAAALIFSVFGFRWLKEIKKPFKTLVLNKADFAILDQD